MFLGIKTGKWSMHYAMPFQKPLYWIQFSHTNWVLAIWWVLMIHEMNGDTQTFSSILCFSGSIQGLILATSLRDTSIFLLYESWLCTRFWILPHSYIEQYCKIFFIGPLYLAHLLLHHFKHNIYIRDSDVSISRISIIALLFNTTTNF